MSFDLRAKLDALDDAETVPEAMDLTADFILDALADALGVESYTPSDGSETWHGDVQGTLYVILRAARVMDDDGNVARHPA